jgi:hypothetical protein
VELVVQAVEVHELTLVVQVLLVKGMLVETVVLVENQQYILQVAVVAQVVQAIQQAQIAHGVVAKVAQAF